MSLRMMLIFLLMLVVVACGHRRTNYVVTQLPPTVIEVPVEVPVMPPTVPEVETIISEKNEYRLAAGQLPLTAGLTCTLHESSNPDLAVALPSAKYTFGMFLAFNQPDSPVNSRLNILPPALQAMYVNNFAIRCQGQIVITDSGYYSFELTSDDGSMLYIGGSLVVNNNFNHGSTTVAGTKLLERGVHSFRLDYAQTGGGSQSLMLKSSGVIIPADRFWR